jgi:hypothetical protein
VGDRLSYHQWAIDRGDYKRVTTIDRFGIGLIPENVGPRLPHHDGVCGVPGLAHAVTGLHSRSIIRTDARGILLNIGRPGARF